MKALYGLYVDADGAQRAFDSLRSASSELKFRAQQIVVVSGEPHEGYEFTDREATSTPYRWAVLGAVLGGLRPTEANVVELVVVVFVVVVIAVVVNNLHDVQRY